jgi:D-aminoacyl-tRNA deacylase
VLEQRGAGVVTSTKAGRPLGERTSRLLAGGSPAVETGVFGAHMALELVNDGPVTIILEV